MTKLKRWDVQLVPAANQKGLLARLKRAGREGWEPVGMINVLAELGTGAGMTRYTEPHILLKKMLPDDDTY
jgi:hypothetical protein